MPPLLATLAGWMRKRDIDVRYSPKHSALLGRTMSDALQLPLFVAHFDDFVQIDALLPFDPTPDRHVAIHDLIARLNKRLARLQWIHAVDINTVGCRYKLDVYQALPITEARFHTALSRLLRATTAMAPVFWRVIGDGLDPADAEPTIRPALARASRGIPECAAISVPVPPDIDASRN